MRISDILDQSGMSSADLAALLGTHPASVYRWVNDEKQIPDLYQPVRPLLSVVATVCGRQDARRVFESIIAAIRSPAGAPYGLFLLLHEHYKDDIGDATTG